MEIGIRRQETFLQVFLGEIIFGREKRQNVVAGFGRESFWGRQDMDTGTPVHIVMSFAGIREE